MTGNSEKHVKTTATMENLSHPMHYICENMNEKKIVYYNNKNHMQRISI